MLLVLAAALTDYAGPAGLIAAIATLIGLLFKLKPESQEKYVITASAAHDLAVKAWAEETARADRAEAALAECRAEAAAIRKQLKDSR